MYIMHIMTRLSKLLLSVSLISLTVITSGCAARQSTITNLPTGITQSQVQSWDSAVADLNKIAIANTSLRQAVIQLHNTIDANGNSIFPSGPAYITTLTIIGKIDQTENAAAALLQSTPNNWNLSTKSQVAAYMADITTAINTLNSQGVTGIKNTTNQASVKQLISEITSIVTIILSL